MQPQIRHVHRPRPQRQARYRPDSTHELDVIHDITPEGRITLAKTSPTSVGWFKSFPWAHPDPTLPAVIYNNEKPGLDKKEVRWALTLAIDIVQRRHGLLSRRGNYLRHPRPAHRYVS